MNHQPPPLIAVPLDLSDEAAARLTDSSSRSRTEWRTTTPNSSTATTTESTNDNPTYGQTPTHRSESPPAPRITASGLRCSPFIRGSTQPLTTAPGCFNPSCRQAGWTVQMGPVLDGVADHMAHYGEDEAFRPADEAPVDVAAALRSARAEVLICYLPVGSEQAIRHYARACLEAGVAMVNCVPVFLASDTVWADRFRSAGLPIIGDDIKSQVGATIVHRMLGACSRTEGSSSIVPTSSIPGEYGLSQHVGACPSAIEEAIEDRVGPEPAR